MISSMRSSLRLFDLRHQADTATGDLAHFGKVVGTLDEGKRHPVDIVGGEHGIEVGTVLVRQRTDAEQRIGKADTLAVGDARARNNGGDDALAVAFSARRASLPSSISRR